MSANNSISNNNNNNNIKNIKIKRTIRFSDVLKLEEAESSNSVSEDGSKLKKSKNAKLKKKQKELQKYISLRQTSLLLMSNTKLDNDDIKDLDLISILAKKQTKRTLEDLQCIASGLSKTKIVNKLKDEKITNDSLQRLLLQLATFFKLEEPKKNEFVFYQGDPGDKFYVIFEGEVDVLIDEGYSDKLTIKEYLAHLINIKLEGDECLVEKIVKNNYNVFYVSPSDLVNLEKIAFGLNYKQILDSWKSVMNEACKDPIEQRMKILMLKEEIIRYMQENQGNFYIYQNKTFLISRRSISNIPNIHFEIENVYDDNEKNDEALTSRTLSVNNKFQNDPINSTSSRAIYTQRAVDSEYDKLKPSDNNIRSKQNSNYNNNTNIKTNNNNSKEKDYKRNLNKNSSKNTLVAKIQRNEDPKDKLNNSRSCLSKDAMSNKNLNYIQETPNFKEFNSINQINQTTIEKQQQQSKNIVLIKPSERNIKKETKDSRASQINTNEMEDPIVIPKIFIYKSKTPKDNAILDLIENCSVLYFKHVEPKELAEKLTELIISINYLINNEISSLINSFDYENYSKQKSTKERLNLSRRKVIAKLGKGFCFGDLALDGVAKGRAASIRCSVDSKLGAIPQITYKEYILAESQRITRKNTTYLLDKYFFRCIPKPIFEIKFYPFFTKVTYPKGTPLFNEGEPFDRIYFINEGEIEYSTKKSLLHINSIYREIMNILINKVKGMKYIGNEYKECLGRLAERELSVNDYGGKFKLNSKTNPIMQSKEFKYNIREYRMAIIGINEVLGSEEYFLKKPVWLNNSKVISNEGLTVFELKIEDLNKFLMEEESRISFFNHCFKRCFNYLKRLETIRNEIVDRKIEKINHEAKIKKGKSDNITFKTSNKNVLYNPVNKTTTFNLKSPEIEINSISIKSPSTNYHKILSNIFKMKKSKGINNSDKFKDPNEELENEEHNYQVNTTITENNSKEINESHNVNNNYIHTEKSNIKDNNRENKTNFGLNDKKETLINIESTEGVENNFANDNNYKKELDKKIEENMKRLKINSMKTEQIEFKLNLDKNVFYTGNQILNDFFKNKNKQKPKKVISDWKEKDGTTNNKDLITKKETFENKLKENNSALDIKKNEISALDVNKLNLKEIDYKSTLDYKEIEYNKKLRKIAKIININKFIDLEGDEFSINIKSGKHSKIESNLKIDEIVKKEEDYVENSGKKDNFNNKEDDFCHIEVGEEIHQNQIKSVNFTSPKEFQSKEDTNNNDNSNINTSNNNHPVLVNKRNSKYIKHKTLNSRKLSKSKRNLKLNLGKDSLGTFELPSLNENSKIQNHQLDQRLKKNSNFSMEDYIIKKLKSQFIHNKLFFIDNSKLLKDKLIIDTININLNSPKNKNNIIYLTPLNKLENITKTPSNISPNMLLNFDFTINTNTNNQQIGDMINEYDNNFLKSNPRINTSAKSSSKYKKSSQYSYSKLLNIENNIFPLGEKDKRNHSSSKKKDKFLLHEEKILNLEIFTIKETILDKEQINGNLNSNQINIKKTNSNSKRKRNNELATNSIGIQSHCDKIMSISNNYNSLENQNIYPILTTLPNNYLNNNFKNKFLKETGTNECININTIPLKTQDVNYIVNPVMLEKAKIENDDLNKFSPKNSIKLPDINLNRVSTITCKDETTKITLGEHEEEKNFRLGNYHQNKINQIIKNDSKINAKINHKRLTLYNDLDKNINKNKYIYMTLRGLKRSINYKKRKQELENLLL